MAGVRVGMGKMRSQLNVTVTNRPFRGDFNPFAASLTPTEPLACPWPLSLQATMPKWAGSRMGRGGWRKEQPGFCTCPRLTKASFLLTCGLELLKHRSTRGEDHRPAAPPSPCVFYSCLIPVGPSGWSF